MAEKNASPFWDFIGKAAIGVGCGLLLGNEDLRHAFTQGVQNTASSISNFFRKQDEPQPQQIAAPVQQQQVIQQPVMQQQVAAPAPAPVQYTPAVTEAPPVDGSAAPATV